MLAATQPDRVEALVLLDTLVAMDWHPDIEADRDDYEHIWEVMDHACERWGQGVLMSEMAPSWVGHSFYGPLLGAVEQACMSPGMARSVLPGYHGMDMRGITESIHVPTLVLHAVGDQMVPVSLGRDLARRIESAEFVELDGPIT